MRERWNHNLHHHPIVLDAVPDGCERALAALHHMDPEAALRRMAALLRPYGRLVVVGLAG